MASSAPASPPDCTSTRGGACTAIDVEIVAVAGGHPERAASFANERGIASACDAFEDVLAAGVDVVDLCVPNHLHAPYARADARGGPARRRRETADRILRARASATPAQMLEHAVAEADTVLAAARDAQRFCMYAENWVYAPPTVKAAALLADAGGTVLRIQGEESHSGTHSEPNKHWVTAGGGALFGKGCHPLGAALLLKREESARPGGRSGPRRSSHRPRR